MSLGALGNRRRDRLGQLAGESWGQPERKLIRGISMSTGSGGGGGGEQSWGLGGAQGARLGESGWRDPSRTQIAEPPRPTLQGPPQGPHTRSQRLFLGQLQATCRPTEFLTAPFISHHLVLIVHCQ